MTETFRPPIKIGNQHIQDRLLTSAEVAELLKCSARHWEDRMSKNADAPKPYQLSAKTRRYWWLSHILLYRDSISANFTPSGRKAA